MVQRQLGGDAGAIPGIGFDLQLAAAQGGALAHSQQTAGQVIFIDLFYIKSRPLVFDLDAQNVCSSPQTHTDFAHLGMARHVGQRFLDDAKSRRFDRRGKAPFDPALLEIHLDAAGLAVAGKMR